MSSQKRTIENISTNDICDDDDDDIMSEDGCVETFQLWPSHPPQNITAKYWCEYCNDEVELYDGILPTISLTNKIICTDCYNFHGVCHECQHVENTSNIIIVDSYDYGINDDDGYNDGDTYNSQNIKYQKIESKIYKCYYCNNLFDTDHDQLIKPS